MGQVTTSVQVSFGGGGATDTGQNAFSAEIDSRPTGFNKGNTSFYPGDTVYILLFKGSAVSSVSHQVSSGNLAQYTTATVEKTDSIYFTNSREYRTSAPITGSYTITWYGAAPSVTKKGENLFVASENVVACGSITYQSTAQVYSLSGVEYPLAVVAFTGTVPD